MFGTSWETYRRSRGRAVTPPAGGSLEGWHMRAIQVGGGKVRYFVDGKPLADHGGPQGPGRDHVHRLQPVVRARRAAQVRRRPEPYQEDVDWVFQQAGVALTPQEVDAKVAALRRGRVRFRDGVS